MSFGKAGEVVRAETRVGIFIVCGIAILFYLSVNIGALRFFDNSSMYTYKVYFEDAENLQKKSPVKIAGIAVGRVENITLMDNGRAEIIIRIYKEHRLFKNSYATISQDSLIGNRTLEVDPGDSNSGVLPPGSTLALPGKSTATVTDLMNSLKEITDTVQDVALTVKSVFASPEGERMLHSSLTNTAQTTSRLHHFSDTLDTMVTDNHENIDRLCKNLQHSSDSLAKGLPPIIEKVDEASGKAKGVVEEFQQGAEHFNGTFLATQKIAETVQSGQGTIGRLVQDDSIFFDVKDTVGGLKSMVDKVGNINIIVDMQSYSYWRTDNSRGLVELQLHTFDDYFYVAQVSADKHGRLFKTRVYERRFDTHRNEIDLSDPTMNTYQRARVAPERYRITQNENDVLLGFLFAKRFGNLVLRVGMIEYTFGVSFEYTFPLKKAGFSLSSNVEAFDFYGFNRLHDDRLHVRWTNKFRYMENVYTIFGIDDLFSRGTASPFLGAGLSFDDDDLKYLFSVLPFGKMVG